ncbi:MAG TPA: SDR family oxidoreductase [Devosiaceae bacterium]|nr:SDR family oxidoreductase [Devosiaceae bacterium]
MDIPAMDDKVCVVTGATDGIGRQTARALADAGATVGLIGRNREKGRQALEDLSATARHPQRLRYFGADFGDLAQVRKLAAMLRDAYERIDVLVNNAGAFYTRRYETGDGFEMSFQVNHLAPFLLTGLVFDLVRDAAPSRIVNVASGAHLGGHMDFGDLQSARSYSGRRAYCQSKLANVLFTVELGRRAADMGVTANAVHPGGVQTGLAQNNRGLFAFAVWLAGPLLLTSAQGADTVIGCAAAPDVAGISGKYFYRRAPARVAAEATDSAIATRLWSVSEALTGNPFAAAGI